MEPETEPKYPVLTSLETPHPQVRIHQALMGRVTEVMIQGSLFAVRKDIPENLDPIKAAIDFLRVYDLKKTAILRKVKPMEKADGDQTPKKLPEEPAQPPKPILKGDHDWVAVGRYKSFIIYKEIVMEIYKQAPDLFESGDVQAAIKKMCHVKEVSAVSKAAGYLHWLIEEGYVICVNEHVNSQRGIKKTYEFAKVPFGAEKKVVAEFDQNYAQQQVLRELESMRQGV